MTEADILVLVAMSIAAADRRIPGRDAQAWKTLTVDEQARYVTMARLAVETYVEAIAERRT